MIQQLLGSLVKEAEEAVDSYIKDAEYSIERYLRHLVFGLVKLVAVSMAGVLLVISGGVFVSIALVEFLALFLPMWAALGLVGAAIMGGGAGMLFLARRMARETTQGFRHRQAAER